MNDKKEQALKIVRIKSGIVAGKALGDAVADFTHATGLDRLASCYTQITGQDCGCQERQEWLNQIFPG